MKTKLLLSSILFFILFSCKKETKEPSPATPLPSFTFKANGVPVSLSFADETYFEIFKTGSTITAYNLVAFSRAQNISLSLWIGNPNNASGRWLAVGNYDAVRNGDPLAEYMGNSKHYVVEKAGDFRNLTITKIEDGYADGTFSVKLDELGQFIDGTMTITEGEFKRVKINH